MSHVSKIELEINNLQDLKNACQRLNLQFMENQQTYNWYGRFVGDTPLPEGISPEDLGKCHHAIKVPGAVYEIGVVFKNGKYLLLWDSWRSGKLEEKLGKDAGLLKQAYAVERIRSEARLKNYRVCEQKTDQNICLVLTV
jgi:hypothetical protein